MPITTDDLPALAFLLCVVWITFIYIVWRLHK
jgi:hypothetical protein